MGAGALPQSDPDAYPVVIGLDGPVGVVAALPAEARCLVSHRIRMGETYAFGGTRGLVHVAGIGGPAARQACDALLAAGARALVSWGCAAGIDGALAAGTVVIAGDVIDAAGRVWSSTPDWSDRVADRLGNGTGLRITRGTLACPSTVLRTPLEKHVLAHDDIIAADMESAAIAESASRVGAPCLIVKAVADTASMSIPASVSDAIDAVGRVRLLRLGAGLLRRPADLSALPRLAWTFRAATRALRLVARYAESTLLDPGAPAVR